MRTSRDTRGQRWGHKRPSQAEQNQELADSQNEDGRVKKLEYDRQEAVLVKDAQTKMISYWQKAKARPAWKKM